MENHFTPKMREKSDHELQEIVDNKEKFQESAILAAIWELERRNKAGEEHIDIKERIEKRKIQAELVKKSFEIPKDIAKSIKKASYILFGTIIISLLNSVLADSYYHIEVFINSKSVNIIVLGFCLTAFLSYMILTGKNWARITFLIIFILGFLLNIPILLYNFELYILVGVISLVHAGLEIYALILLFNKESRDWYLAQKAKLTTT